MVWQHCCLQHWRNVQAACPRAYLLFSMRLMSKKKKRSQNREHVHSPTHLRVCGMFFSHPPPPTNGPCTGNLTGLLRIHHCGA